MIRTFFHARVGKDNAKVHNGKNGVFLSVDVATDIYTGGRDVPMWVRLKTNKPNLVNLAQFLKKGKLIEVTGVLTFPETWTDKNGNIKSIIIIIADSIELL